MIRRQITLPADADRLWAALTDPEEAAGWLGGRIDWAVEEGAPLSFVDDDGSTRAGRVEIVRPGRYLRFQWWDEESDAASEVSYLLEPDPEGTRLTIQERDVPSPGPVARASASLGRWSRWDGLLLALWATVAVPALGCAVGFAG